MNSCAINCTPPDAGLSFGCTLHNLDFFLSQAIEPIYQLVYLPFQLAHVRFGVPLLRGEDAVNQALQRLLFFRRGSGDG